MIYLTSTLKRQIKPLFDRHELRIKDLRIFEYPETGIGIKFYLNKKQYGFAFKRIWFKDDNDFLLQVERELIEFIKKML